MTMRGIWTVGVAAVAFATLGASEARAAAAYCESKIGSCDVSNDGGDSFGCECSSGSAGGGGGGNEWAGLGEAELEVVCFETLELFCGEGPPPGGVSCETELGACNVDNEPDSVGCECANGSGGFGGGGNDWDGLSDDQLYDVCLQQIQEFCDPGPVEWDCENEYGGCDIHVEPEPSYGCGCAEGGDGGGGPGDPSWSELSEDELYDVCLGQIAEVCGGAPPTTTSETDSATSGTEDAGSEDASATAGTEDTGGTEGGETDGEETTGDPTGETGVSATEGESVSASASATDATASAGDDDSSGGADGGAGDGEASGCSCEVDNRNPQGVLALALLGLVGLRARRRRA